MTEGFKTQKVAQGVWHIEDDRGGVLYLVAGTDRALLIDTGWGTGNLPNLIASLTQLNLLFLECGTLDALAYEGTEALHKLLEEKGVDHIY